MTLDWKRGILGPPQVKGGVCDMGGGVLPGPSMVTWTSVMSSSLGKSLMPSGGSELSSDTSL